MFHCALKFYIRLSFSQCRKSYLICEYFLLSFVHFRLSKRLILMSRIVTADEFPNSVGGFEEPQMRQSYEMKSQINWNKRSCEWQNHSKLDIAVRNNLLKLRHRYIVGRQNGKHLLALTFELITHFPHHFRLLNVADAIYRLQRTRTQPKYISISIDNMSGWTTEDYIRWAKVLQRALNAQSRT